MKEDSYLDITVRFLDFNNKEKKPINFLVECRNIYKGKRANWR